MPTQYGRQFKGITFGVFFLAQDNCLLKQSNFNQGRKSIHLAKLMTVNSMGAEILEGTNGNKPGFRLRLPWKRDNECVYLKSLEPLTWLNQRPNIYSTPYNVFCIRY